MVLKKRKEFYQGIKIQTHTYSFIYKRKYILKLLFDKNLGEKLLCQRLAKLCIYMGCPYNPSLLVKL